MSQPWEKREGETPKAFAAFCVYRDMGADRSLDAAWRVQKGADSGTAPTYFTDWSAKYNWGRRVGLYDEHLSGIAVQSVEEGIRQDRILYRDAVKKEAADFAEAAVAMRKEAMLRKDKAEASLMLQRASAVWERARQVEGIALGLIDGGTK